MKKNLVAFRCFGRNEKITMLSIINTVEYVNEDTVIIYTKDGTEERHISYFKHPTVLVSEEEIDLIDSLYYWFRNNHQHSEKPIVIDHTIEMGEKYNHNWSFSLLIKPEEAQIKVKILYD